MPRRIVGDAEKRGIRNVEAQSGRHGEGRGGTWGVCGRSLWSNEYVQPHASDFVW